MCDHWMPTFSLPLSPEEFQRLPRHSAYRYAYYDGRAQLSPRARHYHALLELRPIEVSDSVPIEPLSAGELAPLAPLFAQAFETTQPYGSLDEATRLRAAQEALERTRSGGDGPWIEQASFVTRHRDEAAGAILTTLLPEGDPCDWSSYYWPGPAPAQAIERRLGRPHLTWIFVSPQLAGRGLGTALLARTVRELLRLGYTELLSTFMVGNDSSLLWHWRNGFRLLAYPGSLRRPQRRPRSR
jgi:GNAT superfamily N-acetyltransferase